MDDEAAALRFVISVQIWHPTIDPALLTEAFRRAPFRCWQMGLPRTTMRGDPLPGRWPQSYWVARRRVEARRDFLVALLEELAAPTTAVPGRALSTGAAGAIGAGSNESNYGPEAVGATEDR